MLAMTPVPGAPRWLAGYQSGTVGSNQTRPAPRGTIEDAPTAPRQTYLHQNYRGSPECGFSVVCHLFKRAILVSELVQPICIGRKKAFGVE